MVEIVARSLDPECFDPDVERVYGDMWAFDKQAKMRKLARAAIEAMRTPTTKMEEAGDEAIPINWEDPRDEASYSGDVWTCMIAAALSDKDGS